MIPIAKPIIGKEEQDAILEVIASGQLVQGPKVREFEERFAELCSVEHAIAVSSGTAALHIAMLAHEIGQSDEVITSPFSFVASANCALYVGARPVFVDIEPDFFTIDPQKIEERITKNTKAIMPIHLYGQSCDMDAIVKIAEKHNLVIIEDACQAHGTTFHGRPIGSFGTACYSLYATKNITTIEGGMIVTNDSQIAERARLLRAHGSPRTYEHVILGYNMRLTDLSAAIGLVQLKKLNEWNSTRRSNAEYLTNGLSEVKGIVTPKIRENSDHIFHQYTIRIADRDNVAQKLKEKGIGVGVHYPTPIHQQPLYKDLGYSDILPVAETASKEVLSLPVHPALTKDELDYIIDTIARI
ncbi:MAG: DegT/DnrJ/EryC1/StrS family aminotransferase [Anaerolineales bacterium]|nr:DegT/DnrJ/EryC1/StrS family aminotransferase [Anaerolineales bacterium]